MNQTAEIDVQDIDHLGIIAGIVDEIGMVEMLNDLLGTHPQEQVSAGHVVKALILRRKNACRPLGRLFFCAALEHPFAVYSLYHLKQKICIQSTIEKEGKNEQA